tara:strand:+ start:341 stop:493 length:153 start_codon:yes stop_codon:yes gene_type:complete
MVSINVMPTRVVAFILSKKPPINKHTIARHRFHYIKQYVSIFYIDFFDKK